ncbi:MAG: arsenate reductase (azurin) small subunit [Sulfobacillus sp.]
MGLGTGVPPSQSKRVPVRWTRRRFLMGGVIGAEVVALGVVGIADYEHLSEGTKQPMAGYPRVQIGTLAHLGVNKPVAFDYPLTGQSSLLIDMGRAVRDGVGPRQSIVAYSALCQHMGCTVEYNPGAEEFICPCHQSHYDPSVSGMIVIGQAELPLPRVTLEIDTFGNIFATGVTELIYGYQKNLKNGTQVPLWSQEGS